MKIIKDIINFNKIYYEGLTDDLYAMIIADNYKFSDSNILVLVNNSFDANKVYEKIKLYCEKVYLYLADDLISSLIIAESPELRIGRLEAIRKINNNERCIIITNLMGYLHCIPKIAIKDQKIIIKTDNQFSREEFISNLINYGYNQTSLVTTTGEFAVRGYIIDFFGIEEEQPIRVEFFGDIISSIRYFDEMTQLSLDIIDKITIYPYKEIKSETKISLVELLNNPLIYKYNSSQIMLSYEKLINDIKQYNELKKTNVDNNIFKLNEIKETKIIEINTINKTNTKNKCEKISENFTNFDILEKFVNDNLYNKKTIIFCLKNDYQIKLIKQKFPTANIIINENDIILNKINIIKFIINEGFILNDFIFISDNNIETSPSSQIKYKNSLKIGKRINTFDQIKKGDYVVHRVHGVGIYNGIVTIDRNGLKVDYIQILYKANDKIYIPVEKINTIFKYSSKEGKIPTINRLNSADWIKKKQYIGKKINEISQELINLYAKRSQKIKKPYLDFVEEELFANEFIYEATSDQIKTIADINSDLKTTKPMDRLLCGDVGYGKTEVAFRTIFKAILNGYQVAYLCPTTILSKQQYISALDRFKNYPINIQLLNRFTSTNTTKKIYFGLENGNIDIIFGTHKLLNKLIKYKNLDLLIIDEEQKFGVAHKERIKAIKENINVLTLSATPIPRTLKISLSGIRDLSIIDTPPVNRYPVQTYVIEYNDFVIKEAIYKEITRDGQVFILYNRVHNIDEIANKINTLVPEANVVFAHGQMAKEELENKMQEFIDGKYNIMICTTIIESGIDIPNVNTLIVIDADLFGLSQLYQLRGRVGRSNRIAFAYLMYDKKKILNTTAIQRLNSIQEFTELGSGYKIAMRDLAIRGAGDILGSEQAGFVDAIGIELYMQMINEKVNELNGIESNDEEDNNKELIEVQTHINDDYISDEEIKIEIHKKINNIKSTMELNALKSELEDRFGKVDNNLLIYMNQSLFENSVQKIAINQINQTKEKIEIIINESVQNNNIDNIIKKIDKSILIKRSHKRIIITLLLHKLKKHYIYYLNEIVEKLS